MENRRKQQSTTMSVTIKKEISVGTLIAIGMVLLGIAGWYFDTKAMKRDVDSLKVKYDSQVENWHRLDKRLVRIEERMQINTDIRFLEPRLGIQNKK